MAIQQAVATETLAAAGGQGVTGMLNDVITAIEGTGGGHTHLLAAGATDITASVAELNIMDGVTADKDDLNILDGATLSTAELNYVDGVTSAIQTQMNLKAPLASPTFTGTVTMPVALSGIAKLTTGVVSAVTAPTGTIVGTTDTQTLTNKRNTKRVVTTTDDATAVIDVDVTDVYELSEVANATEFTLTGTPTDGQGLIVRVKDAGTTKGLTWTGFTAIGITLPTDTTANKWHIVGCIYNLGDTEWQAVAVVEEA